MDALIRRIVFWILDFICGNKTRKNYIDVKKCIINHQSSKAKLNDILDYAKNNTKYYHDISNNDIDSFPVVNKKILQDNYNSILVGSPNERGIHWTCTSGSTGNPLKIPQNKDKRIRTKADLLYFNDLVGWKLGYRYVFIRSWVKWYDVSKLRIFAQNYIRVDVNSFNNDSKEKLRELLKKDKKIKCIIAYSSAINDFISYLEEKKDNYKMFNIKLVMTTSDELNDNVKNRIRKMFHCNVVNRISNEEHGMLAMQLNNSDNFLLNTASYYFEILKLDSDKPAKIGELGRLVITDLYNKKFPLIRYDIGDLAIAHSVNDDGSVNYLERFDGRSSDIIYTDKNIPITSVTISTHLCTIKNVVKYQLNYSKDKIIVKIVSKKNQKVDKNEIINAIEELFGNKRKISVLFVDDIPLEKNGKYKVFKHI